MERERAEAFRIYVSDSLALYTRIITKDEINIPRYIDLLKPEEEHPEESDEEIKGRFNRLRRNKS